MTKTPADPTHDPPSPGLPADVAENIRLSAATVADPAMILMTALASQPADSIDDALDQLVANRTEILAAAAEGVAETSRRPAQLEPELRFEPELARVRRDRSDHELRGKLLFADLLERKTATQVLVWTLCGLELSATDATLIDHLGVCCQIGDPCIWPLAIARRISASTGELGRVLAGASANMISPKLGPHSIGAFMRFADDVEAQQTHGRSVSEILQGFAERQATLPGINRPFLGQDERIAPMTRLVQAHGRGEGKTFRLALALDEYFAAAKGIRLNAAGMLGAVYRDLGLTPEAAQSVCLLHLLPLALAQHCFVQERREGSEPRVAVE